MKILRSVAWLASVLILSRASAFAQGPLAPPGPPGETMRSLAQIEPRMPIGSIPFIISQPGSYYLTGNVAGSTAGAVAGIVVAASDVRLDLNGFTLTGNPADATHGVFVTPGSENVKLHGGGIAHWGNDGVHALETAEVALDDLVVQSCGGRGIAMASGSLGALTSQDNGGAGVLLQKPISGIGIVVKRNPGSSSARLLNNGGGGLVLEGDCDAEFGGEITGNTGHGISWAPLDPADGLRLRLEQCDDSHNTGDGLHVAAAGPVAVDCDFTGASFRHNGGDGVSIQLPHADSRLDITHAHGQVADNTGDGLDIAAGQNGRQGFFDITLARNSGDGCNKVDGGSNPGIFRDCVVQDNAGRGLDLVGGSWTLENGVVKNNGSDGVAIGAKKHTKTGHVTLLKRGTTVEDNQGHGVSVYPAEADAVCIVVVENSRSTGNTGAGYHLDAGTEDGSGIFRNSAIEGNDGRGLDLAGGTWTVEGSAVDRNGSDGIVVAARKHTKTGHVSLLKRGSSAERNTGDGVRVYPLEADAECRVVADRSRFSGNTGNGLHVVSDLAGSSIDLDWLESTASGNGDSGLLINPVAMDKGLRFRAQGGACDHNGADGLTVAGDAVESASVRQLSFRGNAHAGAHITGGHWRFAQCTASDNALGGFRLDQPAADFQSRGSDYAFEACDVLANAFYGIGIFDFDGSVRARADISGGRISRNLNGIEIANSSGVTEPAIVGRVHGVLIADNDTFGIASEASSWSITDNQIAGNGASGISVGGDFNHLARNELTGNALGIFMGGDGNAARENTFSGLAPGGGALQDPYLDNTGGNLVAPVQDVPTGVNPLGNVQF